MVGGVYCGQIQPAAVPLWTATPPPFAGSDSGMLMIDLISSMKCGITNVTMNS